MTEHTDGIFGMLPGQAAPGTGQGLPYYMDGPKMDKDIDIDEEPPLEMDPMYAHLQDMYEEKRQPEHAGGPPVSEDRQDAMREERTPAVPAMVPEEGKERPPRRTKARAGDVATVRDMLAIPTDENYQYAISTLYKDRAHLQPLAEALASQITYRNGMLFYQDHALSDKDLEQHHNDDPMAMADVDLPMLYFLYSQIFYDLQERFKTPEEIDAAIRDPKFDDYSVVFYVPQFLEMFGLPLNMSQESIDLMIAKLARFHNIMGIIPTPYGPSHYPALFMRGHDAEKNTIKIMSPYFNQIIMRARRDSYKAVCSPKPKNRGPALPAPIVSTLVKASISKEKNKNAVEMVYRIVALIEQAGPSKDALPHINALELVNRCEHLRLDLEKASLNYKNTILRRTFTRAWELLEEQTTLREHYRNIQFPFPEKMPTYLRLGKVTFEFPHEGKIKKRADENEDGGATQKTQKRKKKQSSEDPVQDP